MAGISKINSKRRAERSAHLPQRWERSQEGDAGDSRRSRVSKPERCTMSNDVE